MFRPFVKEDGVLNSEEFRKEEAAYIFLHQICACSDALMLVSPDKRVIAAQNDEYPMWIFAAASADEQEIREAARELDAAAAQRRIFSLASCPLMAETFAVQRCKTHGGRYFVTMRLNAYECRGLIHPQPAGERLVKGEWRDLALTKKYLSDFMYWAMGTPIDEDSMEDTARELIAGGGLHFLYEGDKAVSMANISYYAPRHAKINYVYTPDEYRSKGYASYLTSCICGMIMNKGHIPMLYADVNNPTSNKIYSSLGFEFCGRIDEITFD